MAEQTERKFGYMIPPPHDCNCVQPPHGCVQPPHGCSTHHEVSMADWMHYINSYIDVRARQIYDKLKGQIGTGGGGQGDTVVVTPTLTDGEKIADITVNGKTKTLYSPDATEVNVEPTPEDEFELPKLIGTISVDGEEKKIYCEDAKELSFECLEPNDLGDSAINVCSIEVPHKDAPSDFIRIYAPQVRIDAEYNSTNGTKIATLTTKRVNEEYNEETQKNEVSVVDVNHDIYIPLIEKELDEIILKDASNGKKYTLYMENGELRSQEYVE